MMSPISNNFIKQASDFYQKASTFYMNPERALGIQDRTNVLTRMVKNYFAELSFNKLKSDIKENGNNFVQMFRDPFNERSNKANEVFEMQDFSNSHFTQIGRFSMSYNIDQGILIKEQN